MKRFLVISLAAAAVSSQAQILLSGPGTYNQNFDSLASSGTGWTWSDNLPTALMPGWYSNQSLFDADDGSTFVSGQYSHGTTLASDRALGSVALPGALIRYGMRLKNTSGNTFASLALSFTGEQWRSGAATVSDQLTFEYSTNATGIQTGTWTAVTSLNFTAPITSGVGALNGNLAANQAFKSGTITGLSWATGTEVWVRWTHQGNASRDALALDNVSLNATPVPEPVSLSVVGIACIALAKRRRSHR